MRIKKLNHNEINVMESKINKLKNKEYYKYYFDEGEKINAPDSAYLLDKKYYIDFTYYDNDCFFGIINLSKNNYNKNSYYELMKLFDERLQHYKKINMWCFIENKTAYNFHKHLIKKYKTKHYKNEMYSVLEVYL
ncbi:hypothetical protein CTM86_00015 [Fusobacterium pseudoperiodonticum]|uniref:Uncharacterized protein n=1 Tax=Fusobacterium pseudoperiodonticum TaxID=2663009 RepID=A0AAD0ANX7_9FUSO|nr:hypothetical protein [Fusobacterium pseudoperiodonticum]ATV65102.1 hypothetical protein CTM86_00015 [Fusobacterium pseudoperiodonticum]